MRLIRLAALAAVALMAVTCTEAPNAPGAGSSDAGHIAVSPSFSTSAQAAYSSLKTLGIDVTSVHLLLMAPDGSVRDTVVNFPLGTNELQIDISVPPGSAGQNFTANLELRNSDGLVLFSGTQQVTAQSSRLPGLKTTTSITINYTGPGKNVKTVNVTPLNPTATGVISIPVVANGLDAAGVPQSDLLVVWTTSDATLATVTSTGNSTAIVSTTGKRGTPTITATTLLNVAGSTKLNLIPAPTKVVVISGDKQTGVAGSALALPLVIEVQAADNLPVPGVPVTFRAITAGAAVATATSTADNAGRASTIMTLGKTAGSYVFEGASGTTTPATVSETATPAPPATIAVNSGDGQSGPVGTSLPQPLTVKVQDKFGGLVSGATVQWSKVSGGGSLGAASSLTDANGIASNTYTLGNTAGNENIRASLPGVTGADAFFTAQAQASGPAGISGSGAGQHAVVNTQLPYPLTVRVYDAFGNGVPGINVSWGVLSNSTASATLTPVTSTTDASGSASTVVTLGATPGPLTIVGTAGALQFKFSETADPPVNVNNPGTLSGFVYDAVSNAALGGVSVAVMQGSQTVTTVTSSGGNYSTAQLPGGVYDVVLSLSGYVTTTISQLTVNGNTQAPVIPMVPSSSSTGSIAGTLRDARTNSPLNFASTVELRSGVNATTGQPLQSVQSNTSGQYLFSNLPAGTYTVLAKATGYTDASKTGIAVGAATTGGQDIFMSPVGAAGAVRIVLTWRQQPTDLDSYLSGPIPGGNTRFLDWYGSHGSCTSAPFACLDVDVTSGFGPETMTISQQFTGIYRYSVKLYCCSPPLAQSGARVDVYINNALVQTFSVPSGSGDTWTVFELSGSTITPINVISTNPTLSVSPNSSGSVRARVQPTSPARTDAALIDAAQKSHPKTARSPR